MDIKTKRYSLKQIMVLAIQRIYDKDIKLGVGAVIENGFYQDLDYKFSENDLPRIEEEMRKIIDEGLDFKREVISINDAIKFYKENNQVFKLEVLDDIKNKGFSNINGKEDEELINLGKEGKVVFYRLGEFYDLCRGPHIISSSELKGFSFKLDKVAGAYWRGDEKNPMLTRIYGVAFESQKELDKYYFNLEEAKKRDHRVLGKQLKLFTFSDKVGPGLPLYLPNAGVLINEIQKLEQFVQEKSGYKNVYSPVIASEQLYKTSGHLQWYKDGMFPEMILDGENYYLKPMSCPFHIEMYKSEIRSYKDLPLKFAEFGNVYRYEQSGELSGTLRVRGFTQDDAHIFCRRDQVVEIFKEVIDMLTEFLDGMGLKDRKYRLSIKSDEKDKYAGNDEQWKSCTEMIRQALVEKNIVYFEGIGEAAFYGPKLDIMFYDSLGREWQISTVQLDFLQPMRFEMKYIDNKGKEQVPMMIHRAPLGSRDRILAVLTEHFAGIFPAWLSPVQVKILSVNKESNDYVSKVEKQIKEAGYEFGLNLRIETDLRDENLQHKIKTAVELKVPYILICGKKEAELEKVSVRVREKGDIGAIDLNQFISEFIKEIRGRELDSRF